MNIPHNVGPQLFLVFSQKSGNLRNPCPYQLTHLTKFRGFSPMKFLLFEAQVNSWGGFAASVGGRLLSFDLVIELVINNQPASYGAFYNRFNNHFVLSFQQSRNVLG